MADIERRYFIDPSGRDKVEFLLMVDEPNFDIANTVQPNFTLEYVAITDADNKRIEGARAVNAARTKSGGKLVTVPKPTPWNPQTDFQVDARLMLAAAHAASSGAPQMPQRWRLRAVGEQLNFMGRMKVQFSWLDSSSQTQSSEAEFNAGNSTNAAQVLELSADAPQLGEIIQKVAPTPMSVASATDMADKVLEILKTIEARLKRGLGDAWLNAKAPNKSGVSYVDVPLDELTTKEELEECWAQHISQLLVASNYVGPGSLYFGGSQDAGDKALYRKLADIQDPACPPVYCCQQLATAACITRGLDEAAVNPLGGTSAGPIAGYVIGAQTSGKIERKRSGVGLRG